MKRFVKRSLFWLVGSIVALLVLSLFFPILAFADVEVIPSPAATTAEPTALTNFYQQVMSIIVPTFVTLIGALATWIAIKIKARLHLDVADKTMQQWTDLAKAAALRAAEWARSKGAGLVDGKKLPGGDVMDVAVNWALQMAEAQKLPALAREKLQGLIESQLFQLRLDNPVEPQSDPSVAVAKI